MSPLLRGELVFTDLNVDGFEININPSIAKAIPTTTTVIERSPTKPMTKAFAIKRFLLTRGQVTITQNDKKIVLSGLQIGSEQFNLQKRLFPFQLKTFLNITQGSDQLLKTNVNFKGSTALSPSLLATPTDLKNLRLEGQLALQDLSLAKIKISKLSARAKSKQGVLLLNPLTLNFYNGESVGDLRYEFASGKLSVNQTATKLDSAKLVYDLTQKRLFSGDMDFSIHGQTNLQTSNTWQDQLSANGSLTIKDGNVLSINIDKVIDEISKRINLLLNTAHADHHKELLKLAQFDDPIFFSGKTSFELLTFQYQVNNSILQSSSLVLQANRLQLTGDAALNLKTYELDSHLLAKVSLSDGKVEQIQQLLGGAFPLVITGTLTTPIVLPNLKIINPILAKSWLQETLTKPMRTLIMPVNHIHQHLKTILKPNDAP